VVEADAHGGSGGRRTGRGRIVAGYSFMLMAIEKYEVRYPLLVLASGIWNLVRVGAAVVSGRAWWKRTRVAGAEVGVTGRGRSCRMLVHVDGDRKI
jgi:hypothetical protein